VAWTQKRLENAKKQLATLRASPIYVDTRAARDALRVRVDALYKQFFEHYALTGDIGQWRARVRLERTVRDYPAAEYVAKRAIEDAQDEYRRVKQRYEDAVAELGAGGGE
jgi:hypothetical protein